MICKRVIASGDVQGVFFRDSCRSTAAEYGVHGWVRNLPDRTVEALFEGDPEPVDRLVAWAHAGPPAARVEDVRVFEEQPQGLTGFEVRPSPRYQA
jgi:acylphosphatase